MAPPKHVKLGALTKRILEGAKLINRDEFPAHQEWADEIEQVLVFLDREGQFKRYLSRLRSKERDAALAESRFAFFLHNAGFRIKDWAPESTTGCPGDLEVQFGYFEPLFVEVKQPGWGSELQQSEISAGRSQEPKYQNADARSVSPERNVNYSIQKALNKFDPARINLVAIADDLFLSPLKLPRDIVESQVRKVLANSDYSAVSGVMLLSPESSGNNVEYHFGMIEGHGRAIPHEVLYELKHLETW
jgi:hypothetical protein